MLLGLSVLGVLLSIILIWFNARRYPSAIYLGLFFLGVSLYGIYHYVLGRSGSISLISVFLVLIPILGSVLYLIGPLFYWYFRSVLTDSPLLRKGDLWHFLPMGIFFLASLPSSFGPFSEKVEAAEAIANGIGGITQYKPTLLSGLFSYPVMFFSRPAIILCYTLWVLGLFLSYLSRNQAERVFSHQRYMIGWLSLLLGALLVMVISHMLHLVELTGEGSWLGDTIQIFKGVSIAGLTVLLISPFFYPGILYGLPRLPDMKEPAVATVETNPAANEMGLKSSLEADYVSTIAENLRTCMEVTKVYLLHDCNISLVAKKMKIPAHHLALFFREEVKDSFTNYRNSWRVRHAMDLLREGKASGYSIEGIGQLSGFSSRNAFFTAFKKVTGMTPGAYSARVADNIPDAIKES